MRFRLPLLSLLAASFIVIPHFAHAAIPFFGPIIDPKQFDPTCPLGWGAVIPVVNNIIQLALTLAIVAVAPIMLAWAGFLMMTSATSIGSVSKARSIIWNTILGIVIALAAWMIVNAILIAITQHGVDYWSSMISTVGQDACLQQAGSIGPGGGSATGPISSGPPPSTSTGAQCMTSNPACSVSALQAAGYTSAQANVMSCIAITESGGNPFSQNPTPGSTACGTFQITNQNWSDPSLHQGSCSVSSSCKNPTCNSQTAYLMSQRRVAKGQSPYSDWTCPGCNAKAQDCVNRYDPNHFP